MNQLNLNPCEVKIADNLYYADCGTLSVLEDHTNPNSKTISLPITRIRAVGNAPTEPIFHLTGGPGLSNMDFMPPPSLLTKHDFVLVGYRGVDGSVRLDSPEVREALKGQDGNLHNRPSQAAISEAMAACASRLQAEGINLKNYTILDVVADLEAARVALNYERINLLSQSYGTRIAQIYAYQHPERINRSIMIGVNPPGRLVWEADKIDQQLSTYARLWANNEHCRRLSPDLLQTMRQVNQNMPTNWLFIPIDPGKVQVATFALLFNRQTAAMVFDAYVAAAKGDASGLALISLAYNTLMPHKFVWGDFFNKAFSADYDSTRRYVDALNPPDSIIGSPIATIFWPQAWRWPIKLIPEQYRQVQDCEVETLLIGGTLDFSTPAEYATQELLPHLKNGHQIILAEMGHTDDIWELQPQATQHLLNTFFDSGQVDDSKFTYAPMSFKVEGMGFPRLAKFGVGSLFGAILALVGGIIYVLLKYALRNYLAWVEKTFPEVTD